MEGRRQEESSSWQEESSSWQEEEEEVESSEHVYRPVQESAHVTFCGLSGLQTLSLLYVVSQRGSSVLEQLSWSCWAAPWRPC